MNLLKKLTVGMLAVAMAGTASATPPVPNGSTVVLHIAGSTAFRAGAVSGIISALGGYGNVYVAANNANGFKASSSIFISADGTKEVKTTWTGSMAGVIDLVVHQSVSGFMPNSTLTSSALATSASFVAGSTPVVSFTAESDPIEVAMSDSNFTSVALAVASASTVGTVAASPAALYAQINAAPIQDGGVTAGGFQTVGIVPFEWAAGKQSSGTPPFTNITQQMAAGLISNGATPLPFFTGNATDKTGAVYLVGRNEDSGTRIGEFAEAQQGFGNPASQFALTFSIGTASSIATQSDGRQTGGVNTVVTGAGRFPITALFTEPQIKWNTAGNSGYIAGGDVSNVLSSSNPVSVSSLTFSSGKGSKNTGNAYFVAVMGVSDAVGAITNGATGLNYNGVGYSVNNIQNGSYTLWSFEHLYYLTSGTGAVSSNQQTVADAIADDIFSTDAAINSSGVLNQPNAVGILFNSLVLPTRAAEGTPLIQNY